MFGHSVRALACFVVCALLVACGGGGGGGGGGNKPPIASSSAAPVDTDGDGHPDINDAFPNDPTEWLDTDKDGVGDNKDLFPNDPNETVDTDGDGLGDNGDTDPLGQPIPAWPTYQADAKHSGRVDITLSISNFLQRWNKPIELSSAMAGTAGDGYIFFNQGGNLIALSAHTGETLWTRSVAGESFYGLNQPAYADGIVYVQTGGHEDAFLWAFNAVDGTRVFKTPLEDQWSSFYPPTIVDGTVYIAGGYYGGIYAIDAKTGEEKWWQTLNQYDQFTPAISGDYAIAYTGSYSPMLSVIDRENGNVAFEIPDPEFVWTGWSMYLAPVVAGDYVLANHSGRLVAFNLASQTLAWSQTAQYTGQPVVKGDQFYIINQGILEVRTIATGALVSSFTGNDRFIGDPLLTNNLVFVRDTESTYAYDLETGLSVWSLNVSGGMLLAEGALTIFAPTGVFTIDVEGDIDADGLPDWWEKRLHKNIDPAADTDGDGLTGLQEFELNTDPAVADTDGDGLLDGEEASGASSPLKADTDGDGLSDYDEIKTHLTDATQTDTDGDSLSDSEEIAAGLDPLDGTDALADSDGDGFSNLHELRANTAWNDANSLPQAKDWSRSAGNNSRTSYNPVMLDESRFSERWSLTSSQSLSMPVTTGDNLIMRTQNGQLLGLDTGTGAEKWRTTAANYSSGTHATQAGKVVHFTLSNNDVMGFSVVDASSGEQLYSKTLDNFTWGNDLPLISNDTLYMLADSYALEAYSLTTGNRLWRTSEGSDYLYGASNFLLSDNRIIAMSRNSVSLFSTTDGSLIRRIALDSGATQIMLGTQDNLLVQTQTGHASSFSLTDGAPIWASQECIGRMAVGNGRLYLVSDQKLCVLKEQTGVLDWDLALPNHWGTSNLVLTANHLFYANYYTTSAINLTTRSVSWSIATGADALAIAADGTLFLSNGYNLMAVDTQGDTDADGLLQWWERRYGGDLNPTADLDDDGLTNLQEYTAKTNPLVADTDGDGLSDGYEVNTSLSNPLLADTDKDGLSDGAEIKTHSTNPLLADSDGDGLDDARELELGLNPLDEEDVTADSDGDGYSNLDEIYSGTDHTSAASVPELHDWAMNQGNAAQNGFQPYRLNETNFSARWSKQFSTTVYEPAIADGHVFMVQTSGSSNRYDVLSLSAVDGKQQWRQVFSPIYNLSQPAYDNGQVILTSSSPLNIMRLDAETGVAAADISLGSSFYSNQRPKLLDNTIYSAGYEVLVANRLDTGEQLWEVSVNSGGAMALNNQHLFYSNNAQINALDRGTGEAAFTIETPSTGSPLLVLGLRNNILAYADNLYSYDLATRQLNWRIENTYNYDQILPVAANGMVLYVVNGTLNAVDEVNGALRWSWRPDNNYLNSNIIATLSHIFVANGATTYALSATTGELLWSYNAGGRLALGADGALYIQSGQQLVAINLEGDSDSDGLPDWWERHYGLNLEDGSDAALDLDSDGLTNLEEFINGSYADQVDSDGDQLSDADEVNTYNTDPTDIDSDGDSMRDDWEIANGFDPLDAADRDLDTDGDGVPNYSEYLVGTDPNDALSIPPMFSAGVYSFEDAALPEGWLLSDSTTDVSISFNIASHGTKSLQTSNEADISFTGFFPASDFSLDIKAGCDYAGRVEIYVDDQLMTSNYAQTDWETIKTVIPLGTHTVSIRSNSYSCAINLDNLVIAAAQTNTQLGVQLVSSFDNRLQFIDANKAVIRTFGTGLSSEDATVQGVASIGNEKLVVLFGGSETRVGVLDLATFNWRYFDGLGSLGYYYSSAGGLITATANIAYVPTWERATSNYGIDRVNLTSGAVTRFGSHRYISVALDSAGFIYALSDGVVYKYDPNSLALVGQVNTVTAQQLLIDSEDRLILVNYNEVVRYNAQRLIDLRLSVDSARGAAVNDRNELLITNYNHHIQWFSADWQRSQTLALPAVYLASFPQLDSDSDGLPDWWELANGLDINDPDDAASDTDSDGLSALAEFAADTNPALDDTDGDLVNDGDEVNDFTTNPNDPDSDSDGLTDGEEVYQYESNPLQPDSDSDSISDLLEVTHFMTDPNDAQSKPAALVNFTESFEQSVTGWITPADTNAGWLVVDGVASSGSKSLRSGAIGDNQNAAVEWAAVFNQSTLMFDALVSSESCCDRLEVYVDGVYQLRVNSNEQWQPQSLLIDAGFHTIKFVYQKDGSAFYGSDAVWIDNIRVQ